MKAMPYSTRDCQVVLGIISQLTDGGKEIMEDLVEDLHRLHLEVVFISLDFLPISQNLVTWPYLIQKGDEKIEFNHIPKRKGKWIKTMQSFIN